MTSGSIDEWTLDGVLEELASIHGAMQDRQFAFILGAGASFTSGIPTGKDLAERWLRELHLRECKVGSPLEDWVDGSALGIDGLTYQAAAEHYPEIFERRFRYDREAGYAALEKAMEGKSPSLGYSLLAEIIQNTRHKVVVTTNFDNLVADALAMHAHQSPLVVAHESLTGFVRPQLRRPLVAKIHRDLFLNPRNDQEGVSILDRGWTTALRKLFQYFTPLVVGYGGNDGSLMGLLASLDTGDIAGRMIWCYRDEYPNARARQVLEQHRGILVKIPGFDDFMLRLAAKLVNGFDVAAIADRIEKLGAERSQRYRQQSQDLQKKSAEGGEEQRKTGKILSRSAETGKTWWAWELKARAEPDVARRDQVYREGLTHFPKSAELSGAYADFLADQRKDYDAAEALYKKALELDPSHAINTGNYANFLADQRKDYDAAEVLYKKALELDSSHAINTGNYASFLAYERKDYDAAEALYKKALELDPSHAINTGNYANFLADQRKDYDAAEALYKKALELDPSDANNTGGYANFLASRRKDYDAAEALYKKALELDPSDGNITGNYAAFLAQQRKDYDAAEVVYKKALELEPTDANALANLASLVLTKGNTDGPAQAMELARRVMELSAGVPSQALAEALLYGCLASELTSGSPGDWLGKLKELLANGFPRIWWDFSRMFESVLPKVETGRRALYMALGEAILDSDKLGAMAAFPLWHDTPSSDPFHLP